MFLPFPRRDCARSLTLNQEIRTSEGSVCSTSEALSLSLHDLGFPFPKADELLQEHRLLVSANELCHWVDEAVEYRKAGVAKAAA